MSFSLFKDTEKDKARINKVALLLGSLGSEEDLTEEEYRFRVDRNEDELLPDVELAENKN